jgi:formylglycine-generating enzyme required for sulfatase activity
VTSRYFGETEELLGHYCWYTKNSLDRFMLEAGSLKPNDYGLFDMQGNAVQWCENKALLYKPGADKEDSDDNKSVVDKNSRVLRGGSFYFQASNARSASRGNPEPGYRNYDVGFRPARTITP